MMPFIYLQARLACASGSISSLDYCCTSALSWTDHQEKQLKSPSVFLPFCPLSLPAAWLHFTFESGFDHVDLSIKSYTETNDSLHSSPGTAVRRLKKITTFFFIFYLHANLNACGSRDGLGQSFFFWSTQFTSRFIHDVFPPCFGDSRQGDPPQILTALRWGNVVRQLAKESGGFQTACEEYRFLIAINASFLSSSEQLSFRAEPSKLADAVVAANFVWSLWDSLWESSGGKLSWKIRNWSIKYNFFMRFYLLLNVELGLNKAILFFLDVQWVAEKRVLSEGPGFSGGAWSHGEERPATWQPL